MFRRGLGLLVVSGLFMVQTACLEGFERLVTTVRYDPFEHRFEVQRTLENVDPLFFGCGDAAGCVDAMQRSLSGDTDPLATPSLGERLARRLLETGALDVQVTLTRDGDRLDIGATYTASLGTRAAEDTMIHAEFEGPTGERGTYRLVVAAQEGMQTPGLRYTVRKQSTSGAAGVDWREYWLLPPRRYEVTTILPVDEVETPMFALVGGLAEALEEAGWLGAPMTPGGAPEAPVVATAPAVSPEPVEAIEPVEPIEPIELADEPLVAPVSADDIPVAVVEVEVPPEPEPAEMPEPEVAPEPAPPPPVATPARTSPTAALWPDPDPESPAKVYRHEARITGPITLAAAEATAQPLLPLVQVCYQRRQAERPELAGYAFLSAVVRGDGFIVSTSVYGEVEDPALLRCLEKVVEAWQPPAPSRPDATGDVVLPFTFRVEEPEKKRRKRK